MTILKCLFNNSTLRVADEFNDIVNLGTLFKFIFDFLQCFSRVQSTLVDDTICIVNTFDHFIGKTTTAQADDVDLRGGMAAVLLGIKAKGKTVIENKEIIERGYENILEKFIKIGVDIYEE